MKSAIITFDTTTDAMAMDAFSNKNNISGRLIPVPNEISAGCGFAWDSESEDDMVIKDILESNNINYQDIHLLEM